MELDSPGAGSDPGAKSTTPATPTSSAANGAPAAPAEDALAATIVARGLLSPEALKETVRALAELRSLGITVRLEEALARRGVVLPANAQAVTSAAPLAADPLAAGPLAAGPLAAGPLAAHPLAADPHAAAPPHDATRTQVMTTPSGAAPTGAAPATTLGDVPAAGQPDLPQQGRPFGRYRLVRQLGEGGMGVVWKAWDTRLERWVALKQIHPGGDQDPELVARFLREAQLAGALRHPRIIPVHDVGLHEGQPYFTADYVPGESLDRRLRTPVPVRQALGWVKDAAEALDYAHAQGIVHRDIKPGNILIDLEGRAWLMDFGLARRVALERGGSPGERDGEHLTVTGAVFGTPAYMSPEQAAGRTSEVGPAADQFALGAVLYHLLTGRTPFEEASLRDLLNAILAQEPVSPRRRNPRLHPDLATICLRALEKKPGRRYPSLGDLAADLRRFLSGEAIRARPVPLPVRAWRVARRHWQVALPAATAVLVIVAVGGHATLSQRARARAAAVAIAEGDALRASGRPREARDAFQRARTLAPDDPAAAGGFGWADEQVRRLDDDDAAERRRAEEARALAERTVRKAEAAGRTLARWQALSGPLLSLESSFHDWTLTLEEKQLQAAPIWPVFERFLRETPEDAASRSTARALAGWARRLAGYEAEGLAWMREAAQLEPELPYGALLEGCVEFEPCVAELSFPDWTVGSDDVVFKPPAAETEPLAARRTRAEALFELARRAPVRGAEAAEAVAFVLRALGQFRAGRFSEAEAALTRALPAPDLAPLERDVRRLRFLARACGKQFDAATRDLREVRRARPRDAGLPHLLGEMLRAQATDGAKRGQEVVPLLEAGLAAYADALRLLPAYAQAHFGRGLTGMFRAEAAEAAGEDARSWWRGSVGDLVAAVQRLPEESRYPRALAQVRLRASIAEAERGGDPLPLLRQALEDCDVEVGRRPEEASVRALRASVQWQLATDLEARGGDPWPAYERALEDHDQAIALSPEVVAYRVSRAQLLRALGLARKKRGEDPMPDYQRGLADLEAALDRDPANVSACTALSSLHRAIAADESGRGIDPAASYARAGAAYDTALTRAPGSTAILLARAVERVHLAEELEEGGADTRAVLDQALADFAEVQKKAPMKPEEQVTCAQARVKRALAEARRGGDEEPGLRQALVEVDQALQARPRLALALLTRGEICLRLGEREAEHGGKPLPWHDEALAAFDAALQLNPALSAALRMRGEARAARARMDEGSGRDPRPAYARALADFDAGLGLRPKDADLLLSRGAAYARLAEHERDQGRDPGASFQRALADFERAVECGGGQAAGPLNARGTVRVTIGAHAYSRHEDPNPWYAQAQADLDAALARVPNSCEALCNRAMLQLRRAEQAEGAGRDVRPFGLAAIADLDAALRRDPHRLTALSDRAGAYRLLGRGEAAAGGDPRPAYEKALADYGQALRLNAAEPRLHANRANLGIDLAVATEARGGDPRPLFDEAIASATVALALNPESVDGFATRGNAWVKRAFASGRKGADPRPDFDHAIADFGAALARNPAFEIVLRNRAAAAAARGEAESERGGDACPFFERAAQDFGEVARRVPGDAGVRADRAYIFFERGMAEKKRGADHRPSYEAAVAEYGESLRLNPANMKARALRGHLLLWLGRPGEALEEFREVLRLEPAAPMVKEALQAAEAAVTAAKVAERFPWARKAQAAGEALGAGDLRRARTLYEEALAESGPAAAADEEQHALLLPAHVNFACVLAQLSTGRARRGGMAGAITAEEAARLRDLAFEQLRRAIELGLRDRDTLAEDEDLAPLRVDDRWKPLLEAASK